MDLLADIISSLLEHIADETVNEAVKKKRNARFIFFSVLCLAAASGLLAVSLCTYASSLAFAIVCAALSVTVFIFWCCITYKKSRMRV